MFTSASKKALVSFSVALVLSFVGCKEKSTEAAKPQHEGAPVIVATALQQNVPIEIKAIGNVESIASVAVRAQVGGELERVYFKEGQDVRKGDLLFQIDPRVYRNQVSQAEANLGKATAALRQTEANVARDVAQAKLATDQAARYQTLTEKGIISSEQNDTMRTNASAQQESVSASRAAVESARANVRSGEATIEEAKIQLGFATIRAPISGTTGSLTVKQGNLVKPNDTTPLVIINQISPIYVAFSVPEENVTELKKRTAKSKLSVEATPAQGGGVASTGTLTFFENTVDASTGTIKLKATLENQKRLLWPGQFVSVVLTLDMQPNAVLVPSQAVLTGQKGNYVFVVRNDMTAEQRPVVSRRQYNEYAVINDGLRPGERVIIDGYLKVVPGAKLEIMKQPQGQPMAAPPAGT